MCYHLHELWLSNDFRKILNTLKYKNEPLLAYYSIIMNIVYFVEIRFLFICILYKFYAKNPINIPIIDQKI